MNPSVYYKSFLFLLLSRVHRVSKEAGEEKEKRCVEKTKRAPLLIPQICDNKSLWAP